VTDLANHFRYENRSATATPCHLGKTWRNTRTWSKLLRTRKNSNMRIISILNKQASHVERVLKSPSVPPCNGTRRRCHSVDLETHKKRGDHQPTNHNKNIPQAPIGTLYTNSSSKRNSTGNTKAEGSFQSSKKVNQFSDPLQGVHYDSPFLGQLHL
jgi:hypothetical protein